MAKFHQKYRLILPAMIFAVLLSLGTAVVTLAKEMCVAIDKHEVCGETADIVDILGALNSSGSNTGAYAVPSEMPNVYYTDDDVWRVQQVQDESYGPQLGYNEPGFGTGAQEVGTVVGVTLTLYTKAGLQTFGGGCQQFVFPPSTYARNMGGIDWGFVSWKYNTKVTNWSNEMLVLSYELAKQQVEWESCPDLQDTELLDHVYVVVQDGKYVQAIPWREYRRPTGEGAVLMFGPGDRVYGWHLGLGSAAYTGVTGENGQDNLCDGGDCYLPSAPTFGWVGGGIVNSTWPGEVPADAVPVEQAKIDAVMANLK